MDNGRLDTVCFVVVNHCMSASLPVSLNILNNWISTYLDKFGLVGVITSICLELWGTCPFFLDVHTVLFELLNWKVIIILRGNGI